MVFCTIAQKTEISLLQLVPALSVLGTVAASRRISTIDLFP
jgi:hypothetical protein